MMADKVIYWMFVVWAGFWLPCYCYVIHCSEGGCGIEKVIETSVKNFPEVSQHKLACTLIETYETACLNNGYCLVSLIEDERRAHCHCPEKYSGLRCEYIDPFYGWEIIRKAKNKKRKTKRPKWENWWFNTK